MSIKSFLEGTTRDLVIEGLAHRFEWCSGRPHSLASPSRTDRIRLPPEYVVKNATGYQNAREDDELVFSTLEEARPLRCRVRFQSPLSLVFQGHLVPNIPPHPAGN